MVQPCSNLNKRPNRRAAQKKHFVEHLLATSGASLDGKPGFYRSQALQAATRVLRTANLTASAICTGSGPTISCASN